MVRTTALKLLIYSHDFAPKIGGVETYAILLAQGLTQTFTPAVDAAVRVTVVTATAAGGMDDAALPFRVVREPGFLTLIKLVREAEVIHLAGPSFLPMLLGLLLRKPVLVEHDGYQASCPNGLLIDERTKAVCPSRFLAGRYNDCFRCNAGDLGLAGSLRKLALTFPRRWLCKKVARNVGPSVHVLERVALPRSIRIHHGVPILQFAEQKMQGNGAPLPFAFVGRLVREKGVSLLLEAARRLRTARYCFQLKIIGDGPERPALQDMVVRYGIGDCTAFAGPLRGDNLQAALRDVPVAIMPSIWEDVAPLAAIEHMMSGRLLIATDIGGLGELVADTGLKFPPGDAAALASCMRRVLDEPRLAKELGEKARDRALRLFREERMVNEHLATYCELVGEPGLSASLGSEER
jgi:glycosyltransferase involved in cell wall biosynthesis